MRQPVDLWRYDSQELDFQIDLFNSISLDLEDEWIESAFKNEKFEIKPPLLMDIEN